PESRTAELSRSHAGAIIGAAVATGATGISSSIARTTSIGSTMRHTVRACDTIMPMFSNVSEIATCGQEALTGWISAVAAETRCSTPERIAQAIAVEPTAEEEAAATAPSGRNRAGRPMLRRHAAEPVWQVQQRRVQAAVCTRRAAAEVASAAAAAVEVAGAVGADDAPISR